VIRLGGSLTGRGYKETFALILKHSMDDFFEQIAHFLRLILIDFSLLNP
jgi:hypothetical protein